MPYRPVFSNLAAEFLIGLPKRRQRQLMQRTRELAAHSFLNISQRSLLVAGSLLATATFAADQIQESGIRLHDVNIRLEERKVRLSLAIFEEKKFAIRIIDNTAPSDRARFDNLASAMEKLGCVAGCNGGFFNRRPFQPAGLMIVDGRESGPFEPNSWMNGLLIIRGTHMTLESTASLKSRRDIVGLLQAGPWLIRQGVVEPNLETGRLASRTFICHDDRGIWTIGTSGPCSLQELATLLTHPAVSIAIDIRQAVNLDGGPSSGFWVKRSADNFYVREDWPVQNYIGVVARQ